MQTTTVEKTKVIKGQCEYCGFNHTGKVELNNGLFPTIRCPRCSKITENFDSAVVVEANDKYEKVQPIYKNIIAYQYA